LVTRTVVVPPPAEASYGVPQLLLGVQARRARLHDEREQPVAERCPALRGDAELAGPPGHLVGERERGQCGRDPVKHRAAALLGGLQPVPVGLHLVGVGHVEPGEHVRVPVHELVHDPAGDVVDGERVVRVLLGDPGVEDHLEQQVAQLLAQVRAVLGVDRLERLVGLLEQVLRQRPVGLLAVPGARGTQPVHRRPQVQHAAPGTSYDACSTSTCGTGRRTPRVTISWRAPTSAWSTPRRQASQTTVPRAPMRRRRAGRPRTAPAARRPVPDR
jgi:hypothetical protein